MEHFQKPHLTSMLGVENQQGLTMPGDPVTWPPGIWVSPPEHGEVRGMGKGWRGIS